VSNLAYGRQTGLSFPRLTPTLDVSQCATPSSDMDRRRFLVTSVAGALVRPLAAEAQQRGKVARLGGLSQLSPEETPQLVAFREGLRDRDYVEGENLTIEWRWARATSAAFPISPLISCDSTSTSSLQRSTTRFRLRELRARRFRLSWWCPPTLSVWASWTALRAGTQHHRTYLADARGRPEAPAAAQSCGSEPDEGGGAVGLDGAGSPTPS